LYQKSIILKIVFFGTPDFAVVSLKKIIDTGIQVLAVVTVPDKAAGRGLKPIASDIKNFIQETNILLFQPEKLDEPQFINQLKKLNAELFVVVAFRKLPSVVFMMPKFGTINLHASLLPDYRGAAPINWAVINGEKNTGVTTFFINNKIDTGDILLQQEVEILPYENAGDVHDKLAIAGANLLVETINGIFGGKISALPQRIIDQPKKAPKIFKEDCRINWERSAEEIYNFIRGLSPYPCAWTILDKKILKIFAAELLEEKHCLRPGAIITDNKLFIKVAASDKLLSLKVIQFEGKKKMSVKDLLMGYKIEDKLIISF